MQEAVTLAGGGAATGTAPPNPDETPWERTVRRRRDEQNSTDAPRGVQTHPQPPPPPPPGPGPLGDAPMPPIEWEGPKYKPSLANMDMNGMYDMCQQPPNEEHLTKQMWEDSKAAKCPLSTHVSYVSRTVRIRKDDKPVIKLNNLESREEYRAWKCKLDVE